MPKTRSARTRTKPPHAGRGPVGAGGAGGAGGGYSRKAKERARAAQSPFEPLGSHGYMAWDGRLATNETNSKLIGPRKHQTYAELMKNTVVVATGVRYYLNLCNKPSWGFEPADETSKAHEIADFFAEIVDLMRTPWRRVVRKHAMSKFLGFSLGVWTATGEATGSTRKDGKIGLFDIAARPQFTIEEFFEDDHGYLNGFGQRLPMTGAMVPLPRGRCVYMVDDAIGDSPDGTGLLRHIAMAAERLARFEQIEAYVNETDMRGIPLIHAPLGQMEKDNKLTPAQRAAAVEPLAKFMSNHVRGKANALMIDSEPYKNAEAYTNVRKFAVELMRGDAAGQVPLRAAIRSVNHEIARVLGSEGLLIGEGSSGNRSTSAEKAALAQLGVEGVLGEMADVFRKDLIEPIGALNGWPVELLPWPHTDSLQLRDIEQVMAGLRDLATAGVPLTRRDEAVGQLFDNLGLERLSLDDEDLADPAIEIVSPKEPPPTDDDEADDDLDVKAAA